MLPHTVYQMTSTSGSVRCGTLPFYRAKVGITHQDGSVNKKWPNVPDHTNINVCSNGKAYKGLSPMVIGPFWVTEPRVVLDYYPNGIHPGFEAVDDVTQRCLTKNLENWWQGSKIYNIDLIGEIIQPSFFERRAAMMADPKPHRRALPKSKGYPVAAYFEGEVVDYLESRFYYINRYEQLARASSLYIQLKERVNKGENLHILGFDGRDPLTGAAYGGNIITYEVLNRELENPDKPFGHELVLCGMLLEIGPWKIK